MKTKKELEKVVKDLKSQIDKLGNDIQGLEQQIGNPDFTDVAAAADMIESVQTGLVAKRSVMSVCEKQLKLTQKELAQIEQSERQVIIASLRLDERKHLLDVLHEMDVLLNTYSRLETAENEIASLSGHPENIPNLKTSIDTIRFFLRNLRGFRSELFGDPPIPDRKTRSIRSAELIVERQKAVWDDLNSKKGKSFKFGDRYIEPSGEAIDMARARLEEAEDRLDILKGTFEQKEKERIEVAKEQAKKEALDYAQGIAYSRQRMKDRVAELRQNTK